MPPAALAPSLEEEVEPTSAAFYRRVLQVLTDAGIRFLVGGAFAQACYTGIRRSTKDLDLFIRREDYETIADLMAREGWRTEMTYAHWLAKVYHGDDFIDLIFNSGNGVAPVTERWFENNMRAEILGVPVRIGNLEDGLLTKAFIMERERYDGADVIHLIQANAETIDWPGLLARLGAESGAALPQDPHVCAGTLLSREQYLYDVESLGYVDGRLTPASSMTPQEIEVWTEAIPARQADTPAAK